MPGCYIHWGKINLALYSICFAGHVRCLAHCTICLSTNHPVEHYPQAAHHFTAIESQPSGHTHYSQNPPQFPHLGQHLVKGQQQWRYACSMKGQGAPLLGAGMHTFASIAEQHAQLESTQGDTSLQSPEQSNKRPKLEDHCA